MVLLHCCNCCAPADDGSSLISIIKDLGPVIISAIALFAGYLMSKKQLQSGEQNIQRTFDAQKDMEARQEIYKKLNSLYGPLQHYREESNQLYQKFSEKYRKADPNFSTLMYLLSGHNFQGNDKVLLEEILKLGEKCENLIHSKAGLIDDVDLRTTLMPRATNHFMLLRLAYHGTLTGEAEKYKDLTFPRELDRKIEERKKQLELDLQNLNKKSASDG